MTFALATAAIFARQIYIWRAAADLVSRIESLNGAVGVYASLLSGPDEIYFSVEGLEPLVSDKHLEEMAPLLRSLKIRSIVLSNTKITDQGLEAVVNGCRHSPRRVDLSATDVSDDSLQALATCPNLRRISIPVSALNPNGVPYLATMKSLEEVQVFGCKSNQASVELLRKELGKLVSIETYSERHFVEGIP